MSVCLSDALSAILWQDRHMAPISLIKSFYQHLMTRWVTSVAEQQVDKHICTGELSSALCLMARLSMGCMYDTALSWLTSPGGADV